MGRGRRGRGGRGRRLAGRSSGIQPLQAQIGQGVGFPDQPPSAPSSLPLSLSPVEIKATESGQHSAWYRADPQQTFAGQTEERSQVRCCPEGFAVSTVARLRPHTWADTRLRFPGSWPRSRPSLCQLLWALGDHPGAGWGQLSDLSRHPPKTRCLSGLGLLSPGSGLCLLLSCTRGWEDPAFPFCQPRAHWKVSALHLVVPEEFRLLLASGGSC